MDVDSTFANVDAEKPQAGVARCVTDRPHEDISGDVARQIPIVWQSGQEKRVVRSTLAAEVRASSEALEPAQWVRHVLAETQDVVDQHRSSTNARHRRSLSPPTPTTSTSPWGVMTEFLRANAPASSSTC